MTDMELKSQVLQMLQTLRVCKPNSARTQWSVRCPYCGDSTKHYNEGHFSILIDLNSDKPMLFRCFRCNESGILNADVLQDLGLSVTSDLKDQLRRGFRRILNTDHFNQLPMKYMVPEYPQDLKYLMKLNYIAQRLDLDIDTTWAKGNKIILGLYPFLEENHIRSIPGVSEKLMWFLNENHVGFLSSNNNRIVFRYIGSNPKVDRYYKMILNPNNVSRNTFYAIPSGIDLMYTNPVHVHMAEGTFDILSVKYNMDHPEIGTHLYYASCGFNFNTILRWLLAKGVNTDLHIHIYSDKDKGDADHKKYLNTRQNKIWLDHVYIHRNLDEREKDYGVPRYRIQDSYYEWRM